MLELAVEALQSRKAGIDAEIEVIRAELGGKAFIGGGKTKAVAAKRERSRTPAERRAQSRRMKKYWAAKKAATVKSSIAAKTPTAGAKVRTRTDAEKKALSLKMKEVWKNRKAATANKKP